MLWIPLAFPIIPIDLLLFCQHLSIPIQAKQAPQEIGILIEDVMVNRLVCLESKHSIVQTHLQCHRDFYQLFIPYATIEKEVKFFVYIDDDVAGA